MLTSYFSRGPMLNILNLFGRSPFVLLQTHMDKVSACVHLLPELFSALKKDEQQALQQIADKISEEEHAADIVKNDIRNHLPKSLFLAMDRTSLLEILTIQDRIADRAEDIAVLTTIKKLPKLETFWEDYEAFLQKNIETFDGANAIIHELHELLESSFGGIEAEKVRKMVHSVASMEHEVDLLQRNLLKKFFNAEEQFTLSTFHLWQRIFEATGAISDHSEQLAHKLRSTLEIK